jgi:N-acetylmuramoyl-L-alanine amidase
MRIVCLLIFIATTWLAQAQPSLSAFKKTSLLGKDYVPITQWAHAGHFRLQWIITDRQFRATNNTTRMTFEIDSRRARINGVNFVLSLPVLQENGTVYISETDLRNTVHPVLFPESNPTNVVIKTVCLDPGHGGRDPGNLEGSREEKKYTLLLAAEVERLLKESGIKVISTRQRETQTVELDDRPKIANQNDADLFVSLHYNAAANKNVEGTEIYCLTPAGTSSSNSDVGKSPAPSYPSHAHNAKSVLLAYEVQKSLVQKVGVEDRGVKRAQFVVLFNPNCAAILIEAGFMTSSVESKRIYDSEYRTRMARAIVDGILAYKKVVER